MGLFLFSLTIFGALTKIINGSFCVNINHIARVGFVAVVAALSYIAIAVAYSNTEIPWMFGIALSAAIFAGISQAIGETAIFGFLKGYPSDMVGDVASGMGFSGIFGTSCLLLSKAANVSNQTIFV